MLAVQLNLCVGVGASSAPSSEGAEAATAAYHSITSVTQRHKKCAATGGTPKHFAPKGAKYFTRAKRVFHCETNSSPRGGCFCFTAISGDFVAGLYRAFGAVMSALRAGYILSLRDKSLGVCAVRTHFDRVVRVNKCWRCS